MPPLKGCSEDETKWQVSVREYLQSIINERFEALQKVMDERHRLYMIQFESSEKAVQAALAAQDKLTQASFTASEKAIVKAEGAQADYNVRSNEFRGQLDDQAKTLMPRLETLGMMKNVEDRISSTEKQFNAKLDTFRDYSDRNHDELAKQISLLRETASLGQGKELNQSVNRVQHNWSIGAFFSIAALIISLVSLVLLSLKK